MQRPGRACAEDHHHVGQLRLMGIINCGYVLLHTKYVSAITSEVDIEYVAPANMPRKELCKASKSWMNRKQTALTACR